MNFVEVDTSSLIGPALDWAVAKALGIRTYIGRYEHTLTGPCILDADLVDMQTDGEQELKHSRSWAQGGPIIERIKGLEFKHWLESPPESRCEAHIHNYDGDWVEFGPTPLIAMMRCYVASKLGDTVQIPKGLAQ